MNTLLHFYRNFYIYIIYKTSVTSILVITFTKNYGESCKMVNEYPFNLDKNLKPSLTVFSSDNDWKLWRQ